MKPILDAVKTRLYGTSTLTSALGSRIYLDQAPPNAAFPLLVYGTQASATVTPHFGGQNRYDLTVNFLFVYSNAGADAIYTATSALETALSTTMSATGFDRVSAVKVSATVPSFDDDAWSMTETYRLTAFDI